MQHKKGNEMTNEHKRDYDLYANVIRQLITDLNDNTANDKEMAYRLLDNIPIEKLQEYMQDVKY